MLDDPQGRIIDRDGRVLFLVEADAVIGCCALLAMADGGFEVAKMAVAEPQLGKGHGRTLMAACIARARAAGAPRLYLETNSALAAALGLYRSFGFRELDGMSRGASDYARVDVWMELRL